MFPKGSGRGTSRYTFYNSYTELLLHFIRTHLSDWNILKAVLLHAMLNRSETWRPLKPATTARRDADARRRRSRLRYQRRFFT